MELITASQAAELARIKEPEINAKREASVEASLQTIVGKIKSAAEKGDRSIIYDFQSVSHRDIVYERLIKLGYKVNRHLNLNPEKFKSPLSHIDCRSTSELIEKEITW